MLATFPLLAMLIVFGALDPLAQDGQWRTSFRIIGVATAVVGVVAWVGRRREVRGMVPVILAGTVMMSGSILA